MSLITSPRLLPGDLLAWEEASARDGVRAQTAAHQRMVEDAEQRLYRWGRGRDCFTGVSWGKDSLVVAHMTALYLPRQPLIYVRPEVLENPDCLLVRDAFLAQYPDVRYEEIVVDDAPDAERALQVAAEHASAGIRTDIPVRRIGFAMAYTTSTADAPTARKEKKGWADAANRYPGGRITGIRRFESGVRERYYRRWGGETDRTLAPIIRWTGDDVFAYLAAHDLPVHPAYAMSMAGSIPRERLRVSSLHGSGGVQFGRREHEDIYYPEYRHMQRV